MTKRILILAGDTDGNLGDLAIVTATCEHIRRIDPQARIWLRTSQCTRDTERLGITPIPRGWRGLGNLLSAVRRSDLVICGGGGLFQDDDSLLKMPYWSAGLLLTKLMSGSINGLSIGAGPLDHGISRLFARLALQQLSQVSVRDSLAKSTLAPLTRKHIDVVPDPAFILDAAGEDQARAALRESGVPMDNRPLIGVAVRRWFHNNSSLIPYKYAAKLGLRKNRGQREMSTFVELTANALNDVVARTNAHVVFLPTYNVSHVADIDVCRAIAKQMQSTNFSFLLLDDPKVYKAVTGLLAVMLCGRMHPAILAAGRGTPIVGVSYNPKFFGTFSMLGQENRCVSIAEFVESRSSKHLSEMLVSAIQERSNHRPDTSIVESRTKEFIEKLITGIAV